MKHLILLLIFLLAGCSPSQACDPADEEIAALNDLYVRWFDAMDIAERTPRLTLGNEIAKLQDIRRDAMAVEVSQCMQPAQTAMLDFMQAFIEGYLAFMAQQPSEQHFTEAYQRLDAFIAAMQEHAGWPELDEATTTPISG